MGVGGIFFDTTDDIGLVITLLGGFITSVGAIIVFIQRKKIHEETTTRFIFCSTNFFWTNTWH